MNNFLDRYQIPKLTQDQIDHLKSSITPKDIEVFINSLPNKKGMGSDSFSAEFYLTFREDLTPILFKLLHKIETEGTQPNSFYEAKISLIINLQDLTMKENFRPTSIMKIDASIPLLRDI